MNERVKILGEEAVKLTPCERVELADLINLTLLDRQAEIRHRDPDYWQDRDFDEL